MQLIQLYKYSLCVWLWLCLWSSSLYVEYSIINAFRAYTLLNDAFMRE